LCDIGDKVGVGLTVTEVVAVNVHPPCVTVYVKGHVPAPAVTGQNVLPTTPVPVNTPPAGEVVTATHASVLQNGPNAVMLGTICKMNTLRFDAGELQPEPFDATTLTAFGIRPGAAADQLTPIWFVPCPDVITPGAATVHV
jgi:hypothetical protein